LTFSRFEGRGEGDGKIRNKSRTLICFRISNTSEEEKRISKRVKERRRKTRSEEP